MSYFGDQLKAIRRKAGFSQEALAKLVDYQRTNFLNIEAGRRPPPLSLLERLAKVPELGVSLELLKAWKMLDEYPLDEIKAAYELAKEERKLGND